LESEEIIEAPERGTAGLTSASQIVDFTDSVSFSSSNTTCALPEHLYPSFVTERRETEKTPIQVFPPLLARKDRFRKALEESIRKNKSILKELAKY
jgi:hypothetical protein